MNRPLNGCPGSHSILSYERLVDWAECSRVLVRIAMRWKTHIVLSLRAVLDGGCFAQQSDCELEEKRWRAEMNGLNRYAGVSIGILLS